MPTTNTSNEDLMDVKTPDIETSPLALILNKRQLGMKKHYRENFFGQLVQLSGTFYEVGIILYVDH